VKLLTGNGFVPGLPLCMTKDCTKIVDNSQILKNCFNSHFIGSGSQINNFTVNSDFFNAEHNLWTTEFVFNHINSSDVCSVLQDPD